MFPLPRLFLLQAAGFVVVDDAAVDVVVIAVVADVDILLVVAFLLQLW